MRVIFCDMDGVVNSQATWDALAAGHGCHGTMYEAVCPELRDRLNRLIRTSGASIVVSSAWRFKSVTRTRELLKRRGIEGKIIGCTPRLETMQNRVYTAKVRGDEIQAWLDAYHHPIESFVIIDDMDDDNFGPLSDHLIQTDYRVGLTDADVERALVMLGVTRAVT